jgi:fructose-bisphosphate aldolase, class I
MKMYRLNRLFHPKSNRCLDVAIDHGCFNEESFLQGIENMETAVATLVAANPDAIQLSPGQASLLQSIRGKQKPALILRTDVANVYGKKLPKVLFSRMMKKPVEQAVRLDAACVVVNLFQIPDRPEVTDQCIQNIQKLKVECDHYQMPLMIEPLVFRPNEEAGGYMVDGDVKKIVPLARQATELGADVIKADPTEDLSEYHRVIEVARVPVLVRGGGKVSEEEVLKRTEESLKQGAAGIVYGRNIIQHASPKGITLALMKILHEGMSASEAMKVLQSK